MPITKDNIVDAAIASDVALDALVAAYGTDRVSEARECHEQAAERLMRLVTEYRRQTAPEPAPVSVEPRV